MRLKDNKIRNIRFELEWAELKELILDKFNIFCKDVDNEHIKIEIEQQKEGSPSYSVSKWKVILTADIVENARG